MLMVGGVVVLVALAFWLGTTRNAEAPEEVTGQTDSETVAFEEASATTTEDLQASIDAVANLTSPTPTPTPTPKPAAPKPVVTAPANTTPATPSYVSVTYDGQNFSPKTVDVRLGGTVRFTNLSNDDMWVASNIHPIHSGYQVKDKDSCSGYAFDMCKSVEKGGYWQFTFTQAGKYGYHNHVSAADNGYVDVIDPNEKPSVPGY